jgi:hypothetical protein
MYIGLHVKCPLFLWDINETRIFSTIFENPYIKFNKNASSESRVVPCGQTDGHTNMTKLVVTLHNFCARAKNCAFFPYDSHSTRWFFPPLQQSRMSILREHFLVVFRKLIKTVLLKKTVSYYENNIYVYEILHVSAFFIFMLRAWWISVNNCPTRCDFMQFITFL